MNKTIKLNEFIYDPTFLSLFGGKSRIRSTMTEIRRVWPGGFPEANKRIDYHHAALLLWVLSTTEGTKDVGKSLIAISNIRAYNEDLSTDAIICLSELIRGNGTAHRNNVYDQVRRVRISRTNLSLYLEVEGGFISFPKHKLINTKERELNRPLEADVSTLFTTRFLAELGEKFKAES